MDFFFKMICSISKSWIRKLDGGENFGHVWQKHLNVLARKFDFIQDERMKKKYKRPGLMVKTR